MKELCLDNEKEEEVCLQVNQALSPEKIEEQMFSKEKVLRTCIRVMRFVQLLCELHHKEL